MAKPRGLRVVDLMVAVVLTGAYVAIIRPPYVHANPLELPAILSNPWSRANPTAWLCPIAVAGSALVLAVATLTARLTTGRKRVFFEAAAWSGWAYYLIAFLSAHQWFSSGFAPIGRVGGHVNGIRLAALLRGIPIQSWGFGCGWDDDEHRAQWIILSAAALAFGATTGLAALGLSRMSGIWASRVSRVGFSVWPLIVEEAWTASHLHVVRVDLAPLGGGNLAAWTITEPIRTDLASFDLESAWVPTEPYHESWVLITAVLGLTWLALILGRYGPESSRRESRAFGLVSLVVLAAAFGPWAGGLSQGWLPGRWLGGAFACWRYPSALDLTIARMGSLSEPFLLRGVVIASWIFAVVAARLARRPATGAIPFLADTRGEPCPT
jgi:hypothetical protein